MKTFKITIGVCFLFLTYSLSAQCTLNDIMAFYYTPNYTMQEISQKRIKISLINASDIPNWTFTYEYGPKGFKLGNGVIGTHTFIAINEQIEFLIHKDIEDNQVYDFYICDVYFGEFQDAKPLLEINTDFEYEVNRLHYVPFRSPNDKMSYPNFANVPLYSSDIQLENGNHHIDLNTYMDVLKLSTHELQFLKDEIPFEISIDYKLPRGTECGSCNIELESNGVVGGSWGKFYRNGFESTKADDRWYRIEKTLTKDDFIILEDKGNYNIKDGAILSIAYVPEFSEFCKYQIDNISVRPIGNRIEISEGDVIEIYGELQSKEGIYSKAIKSQDSLTDYVEYTTLTYHPPLFIDVTSEGTYKVTGDWKYVEWRACGTQTIYGYGKELKTTHKEDIYAIVSDGLSSDTTYCKTYKNLQTEELSSKQIRVYPNPVDDFVHVDIGNEFSGKMILVDMLGRYLDMSVIEANKRIYTFDTKDLSSGMYFVKLLSDDHIIESYKFIVK